MRSHAEHSEASRTLPSFFAVLDAFHALTMDHVGCHVSSAGAFLLTISPRLEDRELVREQVKEQGLKYGQQRDDRSLEFGPLREPAA